MVRYDSEMNGFPVYNEVYMEEEGQLVAMAATLDTENDWFMCELADECSRRWQL